MQSNRRSAIRFALLISLLVTLTAVSVRLRADTGVCSGATVMLPFTDVMGNAFFCQIAAAYFSGLTNGTTATTYTPSQAVPREQMAAFVSRTLDQSLRRGSRRAALGQWWTSRTLAAHQLIDVGTAPQFLASDGEHIYVSNTLSGNVTKVQASTGSKLGTIANVAMSNLQGILVAGGRLWFAGYFSDVNTYGVTYNRLDNLGSGAFTIAGVSPLSLTFDGQYIWTANFGTGSNTGSITRVSVDLSSNNTFMAGFNRPIGILYDGMNLWVTDFGDDSLKRVDTSNGAVLQSIPVGDSPSHLVFDGTNLWVPNLSGDSISVVRAIGPLRGTVLQTLTGNGLDGPAVAAFDGERILVTNNLGNSLSLWKAADLTPMGTFALPVDSFPVGACSDGINFWVVLRGLNQIARF